MSLAPAVGSHDHVQGDARAPLTLVEYGDYECPYCGAAYPVIKELQKHFGRKMRFVFRNFPLTQMHEHAELAAEAAETAGTVGKFWEMHDELYEHQSTLTAADLIRHGESVGVDPSVMREALTSHAQRARVKSDFMSGVRSGVNGTPSFFINGEKYEGMSDLESLQEALAAALS